MDFSELIQRRQSLRNYSNRQVEPEKLRQLAEAVRLVPSACNAQPWTLILVDKPLLKDKVARAAHSKAFNLNRFAAQAPVLAVLVREKPKWTVRMGAMVKRRDFPLLDLGIAAAHFCLQAADLGLGLGTCMMGWFDEKTVKKLLHIPRNRRVVLIISLGYALPNEPLRPKIRKDRQTACRHNRY
ncbi:nitroreductase family protein [Syntrophotalea acetylenica]|uniref:nitroreductase family protein n=1 Tax=Syntrophotalea acetylenica TaxID=29542 RepID=UPI002A35E244|nr:nitroreductase family protein [Syntrophotalea acetylenica]MDY0262382.1 nitroreductase family protein [Syntrophotalea acetylenica]